MSQPRPCTSIFPCVIFLNRHCWFFFFFCPVLLLFLLQRIQHRSYIHIGWACWLIISGYFFFYQFRIFITHTLQGCRPVIPPSISPSYFNSLAASLSLSVKKRVEYNLECSSSCRESTAESSWQLLKSKPSKGGRAKIPVAFVCSQQNHSCLFLSLLSLFLSLIPYYSTSILTVDQYLGLILCRDKTRLLLSIEHWSLCCHLPIWLLWFFPNYSYIKSELQWSLHSYSTMLH